MSIIMLGQCQKLEIHATKLQLLIRNNHHESAIQHARAVSDKLLISDCVEKFGTGIELR